MKNSVATTVLHSGYTHLHQATYMEIERIPARTSPQGQAKSRQLGKPTAGIDRRTLPPQNAGLRNG
jgi:hypothetical protein